jgi:hypothetical protein
LATASRKSDTIWDASGTGEVGFRVYGGLTTYWKGEPIKRKLQSEQGDERPKKKPKKKHRRFTSPVTDEIEEDLQTYLQALGKEESKAVQKLIEPEPILPEAMDIDMEPISSPNPPTSPRPQPSEISATAAAALASTSGMLANRAGAATPPHSSEPALEPSEKPAMPPPPFIPSYRPPSTRIKSKIIAWKISPNRRSLSYLVALDDSASPSL